MKNTLAAAVLFASLSAFAAEAPKAEMKTETKTETMKAGKTETQPEMKASKTETQPEMGKADMGKTDMKTETTKKTTTKKGGKKAAAPAETTK